MTGTPWGPSQQSKHITRGIVEYSTASHGGIHVSKTMVEKMPEALRKGANGCIRPAGDAWFEEDCSWAFVALAFPEHYKEHEESAERTLRNWFPEAWEAYYGRPLQPGESSARDEQVFRETNRDNFIVTSAWGDWAENVPTGMVGVFARRESNGAEGCWLVPDLEYESRRHDGASRFGFVVDPKRHRRMDAPPRHGPKHSEKKDANWRVCRWESPIGTGYLSDDIPTDVREWTTRAIQSACGFARDLFAGQIGFLRSVDDIEANADNLIEASLQTCDNGGLLWFVLRNEMIEEAEEPKDRKYRYFLEMRYRKPSAA